MFYLLKILDIKKSTAKTISLNDCLNKLVNCKKIEVSMCHTKIYRVIFIIFLRCFFERISSQRIKFHIKLQIYFSPYHKCIDWNIKMVAKT